MTRDLTTGSPMRLIAGFTLPTLLGLLFQQLYNLVDTMIVGKLLGSAALAAVGSTGSISFLVIGFCMGICNGFAIPVAQRIGAGEPSKMRRYVANAAYLGAGIAVVLTAATGLLCRTILTAMQTPEEIFADAYSYIFVIFMGIPASILNIGLDFAFILLFRAGVAGAAIATVLSQALSGLACLAFMVRRFPILRMQGAEKRFDLHSAKVLCWMGIPMGLQYSITAVGSIILQSAVNGLGTAAIASVAAGAKLFQLICCPYDAMGSSMATYCGQNVGACKLDRLGQGMRACAWLGLGYAVLAVGAMLLFAPQCAMLFLNQDEADLVRLVSLTSQYITTLTAFFFPLALVNIVRFSIQGMGFSQLAILAGVLEMAARTVMGQVFVPLFGFTAACFASPVAWISADLFLIPAAILCIRHLRKLYPDQTEEAALRPVRAEGP